MPGPFTAWWPYSNVPPHAADNTLAASIPLRFKSESISSFNASTSSRSPAFLCIPRHQVTPQIRVRKAGTRLLAALVGDGPRVRQRHAVPEEVPYLLEKTFKALQHLPDEKSFKQACRSTVDTFIQQVEMPPSLAALKMSLLKYIDLQQTAPALLAAPFSRGFVKGERFRHKPIENFWNAVLPPQPASPFTTRLLPQFLTEVERHIDRRVIGEPLLQWGRRLFCQKDAEISTQAGFGGALDAADDIPASDKEGKAIPFAPAHALTLEVSKQADRVATDFHNLSDWLASYLPGNQDWTPHLVRGCSTLPDDELKGLAHALTKCCADPDLSQLLRPRYPRGPEETRSQHWLVVSPQQGATNEHLAAVLPEEGIEGQPGLEVKNEPFLAALQRQGARDERLLIALLEALRRCVIERLQNAPTGGEPIFSAADEENLIKANITVLAQSSASLRVNYLGLMDDAHLTRWAQYFSKEETKEETSPRQNSLSLNRFDSVSIANIASVKDALRVVRRWQDYQLTEWWAQAEVNDAAKVIVQTNSLHRALPMKPESIALLHTELLVFPKDPPSWRKRTLTRANGETFYLQVGPQFCEDTITRSLVSLSVRGLGSNGSWIQHTALVPGLTAEWRESTVDNMLVALDCATGGYAGLVTLITTQQIVGAMSDALLKLGSDSPIRLTPGSDIAVMPGAAGGRVHFDVVCPPYGPMLLHTNIQFNSVNNYVKISAQPFVGGRWNPYTEHYEQNFELDPARSYYHTHTAFFVWLQERRMAMAAPIEFDYAFYELRALD